MSELSDSNQSDSESGAQSEVRIIAIEREEIETIRTEFFSDAVLAIALTLLVLDLDLGEFRQAELGGLLIQEIETYTAFFVSFLFIAVTWHNHHAAFNRLKSVSSPLLVANFGILLGATLLPFPTGIVATAFRVESLRDEQIAVLLYGLLAFVMSVSWTCFFQVASRDPHLWKDRGEKEMWGRVRNFAGFIAVGYFIAAILGFFLSPWLSIALFAGLLIIQSTQAHRMSPGHKRNAPQAAASPAS
ncbi:unannotated protein [freshwater metagenome]|uniref:Unannotated protein n=1 Tax=freshwater metagenome TaxID=449393 RepID=A0A6J6Q9P4_9ZZZZ|nr:TMEM175 family protein [Actinomycetota bacterium]MSV48965.1 DUF1211 domain-containing protein [Actinomycetota bacterium]MSV85674.1 DUF1211 domain-containing protein [Actinomycetota bacterium]MSX75946.1 DUF1211 domain-containing protein [Actinomycetota bacterium]MSY22624.1 DUF1211 domain-containing protein [Actinomycetota bacterium]